MTEKKVVSKVTASPAVKTPVAARKPATRKAPASTTAVVAKVAASKVTTKKPLAVATPAKKAKKSDNKMKVVRDSFSMPKNDYAKIGELKELCLKSGMKVKKSELLRAGLHALSKLNASQLKQALSGLEAIKTGRPKKQ